MTDTGVRNIGTNSGRLASRPAMSCDANKRWAADRVTVMAASGDDKMKREIGESVVATFGDGSLRRMAESETGKPGMLWVGNAKQVFRSIVFLFAAFGRWVVQRSTGFVTALIAMTLVLTFAMTMGAHAAPKVVASIKPVHSLVASVMKGVGEPDLLLTGAASPHDANLKPSQAHALQDADIVFRVGDMLEVFLDKPLATVASTARVVDLIDTPGLSKLDFRSGDAFDPHEEAAADDHGDTHDDDHGDAHDDDHGHGHDDVDPHVWLDPENAIAMAKVVAEALGAVDPGNARTYMANARMLNNKINAAQARIAGMLAPVGDKPFIVFHDAYRYFEVRFGLRAAGSIALNTEVRPGARRISAIREKVDALGAICVFSEPQFDPKLVEVIAEGTGARIAVLDPLGASLEDGPDLYIELLEHMARAIAECMN